MGGSSLKVLGSEVVLWGACLYCSVGKQNSLLHISLCIGPSQVTNSLLRQVVEFSSNQGVWWLGGHDVT